MFPHLMTSITVPMFVWLIWFIRRRMFMTFLLGLATIRNHKRILIPYLISKNLNNLPILFLIFMIPDSTTNLLLILVRLRTTLITRFHTLIQFPRLFISIVSTVTIRILFVRIFRLIRFRIRSFIETKILRTFP